MAIVLSGTTGIDAGSLPVSNCGNTEVEGNLNLSGVGTRITGDFSNSTLANRVAFQTSTINGHSSLAIIPNGTGASSNYVAYNSSDMLNASNIILWSSTSAVGITADKTGTGSYLPITFITGGSERMRIDSAGNVGIGTAGYTGFGKLSVNGQIGMNCSSLDGLSARGLQFFIDGTKHGNLSVDNYDNLLYIGNGIGYGTGAGGTVTQLTSKSTAVTLNKPTGKITMNNASLAAGGTVEFTLNNSLLGGTDMLVVAGVTYSFNYTISVKTAISNSAVIRVTNVTGTSQSDPLEIQFAVIKGATA